MFKNLNNPSVMEHNFSQIPMANVPRSNFRRSHGYKTAFDSSYLVPIFVDEALPGDTFNVNLSSVARLATPIVPFMDNLFMDIFFFAVPNRILWTNWEKFMGAQDNPADSTDFLIPTLDAPAVTGFATNSLGDYFGLPIGVAGLTVNSLHFRAYNLIWNEWFRDQNLQDSVQVDLDDGPDDPSDYVLLKRNKRHDYFTSCLPWPQKGTEIDLPIGTSAPLTFDSTVGTGLAAYSTASSDLKYLKQGGSYLVSDPTTAPAVNGLYADLSSATASTINDLREAFQLQKLMERDARGGTRYVELLKSHFGVSSPDYRVQRPEYLGGGSSRINVSAIPQTSESGTTPQGTLAAIGYHTQVGIGFTKSFTEHCTIIGLANVRADLTYQQGLDRMWSRQTKYDFYFPSLAHLGEQAILNKEIFADGSASDDLVFGYNERWSEYRYKPSKITGILRSDAASSLDVWHLSQDFASLPSLNSSFITEDVPVSRVVAVPSEPEIIFDGYFDIMCTRPMPTYSVPGLIDHF